jgi:integrase
MSRQLERLTALQVRNLDRLGIGTHADGGGLYLQVTAAAAGGLNGSWLFRYARQGKAHWLGLGSAADVSLAEARKRRREERRRLAEGRDPLTEKRERQAVHAGVPTFRECARLYIEAHKPGWKNGKHAEQWTNTLAAYAYPEIGSLGVDRIDTADVLKVLEPIWRTKTETASRLRGRIENILAWATVRGYRSGDNPARWRHHLAQLLPARAKVQKVEHHAALSYRELPAFVAQLVEQPGVGALALRFTILTACRTAEVVAARWAEIDLDQKIWTIPASRMKAGREHRVALSEAALAVLEAARAPHEGEAYVFLSAPNKPLSTAAMASVLRRMKRQDITVHGFRSTFRDWAAEETNYPRELAEAALAHDIRTDVEAAYQRGDLLRKRAKLMEAWSSYATTPKTGGTVTAMRRARS